WAALYWEKIDEWFRAARNWEKVKKWENAARCWNLAENYAQAAKAWDLAGNKGKAEELRLQAITRAEELVKGNHFSKAAVIFEDVSLWNEAAKAWESSLNWTKAKSAYLKFGDDESAKQMEKKAKEEARELKEKHPYLVPAKLMEMGDVDRASKAWSSKEWARSALKFEKEGNTLHAAVCWMNANEWAKSGDAYSSLAEWDKAYRSYERSGNLDKMAEAERKAEESAYLSEKNRDWKASAKKWETLRRWEKAAAAWERMGDIDAMRTNMERYARVAQDQGNWINAAVYWKELGEHERAIECYSKSRYNKTPQELSFYLNILVNENVADLFLKKERFDIVAYKYLIDGALKNDFQHRLSKMEHLLRDAIKSGDFYIITNTAPYVLLCAYYSNMHEKLISLLEEQTAYYESILSSVSIKETKLLILGMVLDIYRALYLISGELGESERQKIAADKLHELTRDYLVLSHKKITSKKFLMHYVAYSFLREDYKKIPHIVGSLTQTGDVDISEAISDLAQDMETASNPEVAYMYYNYLALKEIPLSSSMSLRKFLDGFNTPRLKYLSPEYFLGKTVSSKIELRSELYDHYQGVLKKADDAFELSDYRKAVKQYEEFLNFSVTIAAKNRTRARLIESLSHLKGESEYDLKLKKYT
ncbi:hypothetical protein ACFLQI_03430, partial [Candidatus Undinarchaeota archaeon]